MRIAAAARISLASAAMLGVVAMMGAWAVNLQVAVPLHHLRLAWTVTRLLVQL